MTVVRWARHAALTAAAAAAVIAAAACGGDDETTPSGAADTEPSAAAAPAATPAASPARQTDEANATAYDACALLTDAEVEATLGEPAGQPVPGAMASDMGQQTCIYGAASGDETSQIEVSVIRERDFAEQLTKSGIDVKKAFEQGKTVHQSIEPIADLGDEAYRSDKELLVRSGTVILGLGAPGISTETLVTLANSILERVPQ